MGNRKNRMRRDSSGFREAERHGSDSRFSIALFPALQKQKAPRVAGLCRSASAQRVSGLDADRAAVLGTFDAELNLAVDQCEQRVIAAEAHAVTRMKLGTALAHDDVAGFHGLSAV